MHTETLTSNLPFPMPSALDEATRAALESLCPRLDDAGSTVYGAALEQLAVDSLKGLIMDTVEKANSGHPGGPLSSIDFTFALFADFLKCSSDETWLDRDRFVLSGGHMSTLLYTFLHLTGRLSMEDLMNFRQLDSPTQGHPVYRLCPGVETSTGPLGQGFGNGVGMAMAEKILASSFGSDLVDHHTYVVATDGDIQEGICREAAALAGLLHLGKLIVFYDSNRIQLASATTKTMYEDVGSGFTAMGWDVIDVPDGHDRRALREAIARAKEVKSQPTLIVGHTKIAHGTGKEGTTASHGAPMGSEVIQEFKSSRGHPSDQQFWVPSYVYDLFKPRLEAGDAAQQEWGDRLAAWRSKDPARARDWDLCFSAEGRTELLKRVAQSLKTIDFSSKPKIATRSASAKVMEALADGVPNLVGGSADLANSTKTDSFENKIGYIIDGLEEGTWKGRGIHFGVREHAMGSTANGMALHGGLLPYTGTFLVFSDYMRPAIRLAGISRLPVTFIFTHDSIFLGEDGETHQPVEHLWALRTMPRIRVIRPADANECLHAWRFIFSQPADAGPVVLVLSRQDLPVIAACEDRQGDFDRGAYVVWGEKVEKPDIQVIATGSEVSLAIAAATILMDKEGKTARVISMPCVEQFQAQSEAVRNAVLLPEVPLRMSVEAGTATGWKQFTGDLGTEVSIEDYGESAPMEELAAKHGFLPEPLARRMSALITDYPRRAEQLASRLRG